MNFEYLLFNILVGGSSWMGNTLYPLAQPINLKSAVRAWLEVGLPFVIIDAVVTNWFWSFNPQFVTGWKIGPLPIEEVLFFMSVPLACLVLWVNLKKMVVGEVNGEKLKWLTRLALVAIVAWAVMTQSWYTLSVGVALVIATWLLPWQRLTKASLVFAVITTFLTLVFNMYLTARPVVLYNPAVMSNVRVGSIPVEDFGYGWLLVLGVIASYERALKKQT